MSIATVFIISKSANKCASSWKGKQYVVYEISLEKVQPLLIQWERFAQHWCNLAAKKNGLECVCEHVVFTVLDSGDSRCSWVLRACHIQNDNESASNFALSLNVPPWKLFGWFRRPPLWATNWWLAASQQCSLSCITSCAEFFGETSNHPGDSTPLQPRFEALWLLAFPKTKITFEREEISDRWWDSGKYDGAADGDWENCVRP